jgi:hypothetical protein
MRKYYQGKFQPKNPEKYVGNVSKIIFRSMWEKKFFIFCDNNPSVIRWNSEGLSIPYFSEEDNKTHKYYPDVMLTIKAPDNTEKTILIEIKPKAQTTPPKGKKMTKRLAEDIITYNKNQNKWSAARIWCEERDIEFKILTETDLGIK